MKHRLPSKTESIGSRIDAPVRIAVGAEAGSEAAVDRARTLAAELNLPFANEIEIPLPKRTPVDFDWLLIVTDRGLELREVSAAAPRSAAAGGVRVDFGDAGANARRLTTASRAQPLARAIGLNKGVHTVVDATAGLGRDAAMLARLGCDVTAIERSPVLGALWRDALNRARAAADEISDRVTLIVGDAREVLEQIVAGGAGADRPDAVYLDPMFDPKGKSALPKKEMRILRRLVGDDADAAELLASARRAARLRVVVKRTPRAAPLGEMAPTMSYESKLVRYDVYLHPTAI